MTRNNESKSKSNCNFGNQGKQAKKPSQPLINQIPTRAILKMTALNPSKNKITESFKDEDGNKIKEWIHTYQDGNHTFRPQEATATTWDAVQPVRRGKMEDDMSHWLMIIDGLCQIVARRS